MPTFDEVLQRLRPGKSYSNPDGTLANVVWEEGVVPPTQAEYDAASFDVVSVSRLRLKLELAERGLLGNVEAAVQAGGAVPQLYWAEATTFESNHPLVAQIGAAIGLSGDEIKALFKAAAEREA